MRLIGLAVILTLSLILAPLAIGGALPVDAAPEGQITWAFHVTVVPAWFDPGEASVGSAPAAGAESSLGRIQLHYTAPFDDLRLR